MPPVTVLLLGPLPDPAAGPLERLLDEARAALLEHHRAGFEAAGAARVVVRQEPPDDTPFGARLRRLVQELAPEGLVVMGAGSMPFARPADLRAFVDAAASHEPGALANHRYSADCIAIARAADTLRDLPRDLTSDNALPRWLAEAAGIPVRDLRARRHLAADIDSPLDLLVLADARRGPSLPRPGAEDAAAVRDRLSGLRAAAADSGAELLVAGRLSSVDLRWIETNTQSRTRALIEERGLRTASAGALVGRPNRRPARSVLGMLLDREGPGALGTRIAELADGAVVDSRVLLAHRLGADERAWPSAEDRFASDLLLVDRVHDPWLAELTASAAAAPVPVLLGGHGVVGPGIRQVLGTRREGMTR